MKDSYTETKKIKYFTHEEIICLKIILNVSHPELSDPHVPVTSFNSGFSIPLFLYWNKRYR